jgi:hypothetical protein
VVEYSNLFDEELDPNPDPFESEKLDPYLLYSEKLVSGSAIK